MAAVPSTPHKREASSLDARALFAAFAGLCGSLVAVGLARFAYTPLTSMIQAHWFSSSQTVALGAANFAGYLIGAMAGRPLAAKLSNRSALRFLMAAVTIAFFACAWPVSVPWFFFWRLLSGTSIPQLLATGLRDTWLGLGVLSLSLTALSWFGWPATNPPLCRSRQHTRSNTGASHCVSCTHNTLQTHSASYL